MKEDAKKKSDLSSKCPNCGHGLRYVGKIQSGMFSVKLYRCSHCKREFVEEELRKIEVKT